MAEVIRMPRMSDTMEEGNIVGWLKKVGDEVEPGDVLAEVETDKATMELESFHEGVLLHIGVEEGAVPVNSVLAVIGEEGEDFQAALDAAGGNGAASDSTDEAEAPSSEDAAGAPSSKQASTQRQTAEATSDTGGSDDRTKASPLARSMAKESGIDLSSLTGTGDGGRIVRRDVEAVLSNGTSKRSSEAPESPGVPASVETSTAVADYQDVKSAGTLGATPGEANYKDVPTTQMRKVIAKRLAESKFTAPHFYLGIEIDMTGAIAYRKELNTVSEVKISFNDLVLKASAQALRKHPAINSSWLGDRIRVNSDINIGVAVAVEDGLLVPVVRHADRKGLAEIDQEVKQMAGLAKERRLQPQQMQGNTFTISNLGMFDITEFTAIINPPDACILAVGTIKQRPVVKDGEIVVGNVMKLTLSCDHRVVDGATGAAFLTTLKEMLENPLRMLI